MPNPFNPRQVRRVSLCREDVAAIVFWTRLAAVKDRGQRPECGCAPSCDIGRPDSCLHGCAYRYATSAQAAAESNHRRHDPDAPAVY